MSQQQQTSEMEAFRRARRTPEHETALDAAANGLARDIARTTPTDDRRMARLRLAVSRVSDWRDSLRAAATASVIAAGIFGFAAHRAAPPELDDSTQMMDFPRAAESDGEYWQHA